jgi:hypothetical protein
MAQGKQIVQYQSFVAGLITEATELTFPPNASFDEDNCVLFPQGNRKRRRGFEFEPAYVLSTAVVQDADLVDFPITTFNWKAVGGDGDLDLLVVQLGDTLYYYDQSADSLSVGIKTFTTTLTSGVHRISASVGRGALFVVAPDIEPFYVSYDVDTDDITETEVGIRIRDLDGVDDGLAIDEEETPTLSTDHHYNLLNQGWYITPDGYDPITAYETAASAYPANNLQWTAAKTPGGAIDATVLRRLVIGTTSAPRGHFILDPFNKDRDAASGLTGITGDPVTIAERPHAVSFYAGRACYGMQSQIYISEVLKDDLSNAGKCYQDADPTSEEISDLVDSDGMIIKIPEAGEIYALETVTSGLMIFANNGVWQIAGSANGGFKATDFTVTKITSAGILSRHGMVVVEGTVYWLSATGIFSIKIDPVAGYPQAVSITDNTIKTLYLNIEGVNRTNMIGSYDMASKRIAWLYKDDTSASDNPSPFYYNRVLYFDIVLNAFYTWSITDLFGTTPWVAGLITSQTLIPLDNNKSVLITNGDTVLNDAGDEVIAGSGLSQGTLTRFLTIVPDQAAVGDNNITFSVATNSSFTDWENYDIIEYGGEGWSYDSYLLTGFDLQGDSVRYKQVPYIITHCKRTETAYELDGTNVVFDFPSSLRLQARWDWHDSGSGGKWSSTQQIYRNRRNYVPDETTLEYDPGNRLVSARSRLRGRGRALQLKFSSEEGKDFDLLGWGIVYTGNTEV